MREVPGEAPPSGIPELKLKLAAIREQQPEFEHGMITEVVRAVLTTISDDLTLKETTLLREVEELGRTIAIAKSEIAALQVDDITDHDIPFATDELDAIVEHTAHATHAILESCEMLDEVSTSISGDAATKLQDAVTRIYEACSFQDLAGQRITNITKTLGLIEGKLSELTSQFGLLADDPRDLAEAMGNGQGDSLENVQLSGPQHPDSATDQASVDRLFAQIK